jgi:predicted transcriptional regulator YheO
MNKAKAGVDGKSINVVLPHSEILSHEIDEGSIMLVSVKNGIFNRVTPDNMNEVRKKAKESKEKRILESDFLEQADKKAVNQVETFLKSAYADAEVNVKVDSVS